MSKGPLVQTVNDLLKHYRDQNHDGPLRVMREQYKAYDDVVIRLNKTGGTRLEAIRKLVARVAEDASITTDKVGMMALEKFAAHLSTQRTPYMVTLQQAAPLVHKSKRTLERWCQRGKLPSPDIRGGGRGQAHSWRWNRLRPALEKETGMTLPARFPADCSSADSGA